MFKSSARLASQFTKAARARPFLLSRCLHRNDGPRKEYFVLVWDHPQVNRSESYPSDFVFPQFTFAGECLSPGATPEQQKVQGNAFACLAHNVDEVWEIMTATSYYKTGVWDISTAQISPLMTVHSKEYQHTD